MKTATLILILKKRFLKSNFKFSVTSGFSADFMPFESPKIEARRIRNSKLIITDPDPANNFGSERIRIHNSAKRAL